MLTARATMSSVFMRPSASTAVLPVSTLRTISTIARPPLRMSAQMNFHSRAEEEDCRCGMEQQVSMQRKFLHLSRPLRLVDDRPHDGIDLLRLISQICLREELREGDGSHP